LKQIKDAEMNALRIFDRKMARKMQVPLKRRGMEERTNRETQDILQRADILIFINSLIKMARIWRNE
jgi:S-adenosylmethionine:tRNA-ribosyltransferase-isomerase (queuine synthetase)